GASLRKTFDNGAHPAKAGRPAVKCILLHVLKPSDTNNLIESAVDATLCRRSPNIGGLACLLSLISIFAAVTLPKAGNGREHFKENTPHDCTPAADQAFRRADRRQCALV